MVRGPKNFFFFLQIWLVKMAAVGLVLWEVGSQGVLCLLEELAQYLGALLYLLDWFFNSTSLAARVFNIFVISTRNKGQESLKGV
ncbi:hypothetical protein RchiOBHm_Chr5g0069711 [Rosa chinensis]|uniref:Uncharacterized protein n=1 Tax=Rosa chinensis TaxID=74649 RepID=A0A2P6QK01_ROSCH|nr:hypothetical protein RchiOBHm_Chr5g0069711 [Rosa chinensis]